MMKCDINKIKGVSESLFLPLFFRAAETLMPDPIIVDPKAVEIVRKIPFDFSAIAGHTLTHMATMMRVREFDRIIKTFLKENPRCTVVNIGCGLGSRFFRIDNGCVVWYELDFPEVIALREQFFEQFDRYRFISRSALDFSWMDTIEKHRDTRLLFVAEGVLMYLPEKNAIELVRELKNRFPGAILVFDIVTPLQAVFSYFHPTITTTSARFRWGISRPREVETWDFGIEVLEACYYFDRPIPRLGILNFFRCLPHIAKGVCAIRCKLGKSNQF